LLASLEGPGDDPAEVAAAWAAEIERRARRIVSGESTGEPWEKVRRSIEADLKKR